VIQYLQVKGRSGTTNKFIVLRERKKKFSKDIKETYIPKKDSIFIYGAHASGKSKELYKLYNERNSLYPKDRVLLLIGTDSIADWLHKNLDEKDKESFLQDEEGSFTDKGIEKELNKQYVKIEMLKNISKGATVFIDDLDQVHGKKLELLKDILRHSKRYIVSAKDDRSINKTLLEIMQKRHSFKEISLQSEVSYDITNIFIFIFIIALIITGHVELAILIFALRFLMKGITKK
jgi:hypothetical protein